MKFQSGSWGADFGPELMDMVRRVADGAVGRVFDALEKHGEELITFARMEWPGFTGHSYDMFQSVTIIGPDYVKLRVSNEATKASQLAVLKGMPAPAGKSRAHYMLWRTAQNPGPRAKRANLGKFAGDFYAYKIGRKPSHWKARILDPQKRGEDAFIESIAEDLARLAEGK
jgi:hypothetical protein